MSRKVKIYQVDSFTSVPFKGNPAGVCILENEMPSGLMQAIAAEMNLSETAFTVKLTNSRYELRWFTPAVEVDLCGHATLATAKVLFDQYRVETDRLVFSTKSGELAVSRMDNKLCMDFPTDLTDSIPVPLQVLEALGLEKVIAARRSRRMGVPLFEVAEPKTVRNLSPDLGRLAAFGNDFGSAIVTARSDDHKCDFISRFFAPRFGINEDPVTGAAHTILGPYWGEKLQKTSLRAYQASARGGEMDVMVKGERVDLIGQAVLVLEGDMEVG